MAPKHPESAVCCGISGHPTPWLLLGSIFCIFASCGLVVEIPPELLKLKNVCSPSNVNQGVFGGFVRSLHVYRYIHKIYPFKHSFAKAKMKQTRIHECLNLVMMKEDWWKK